MEKEGEGRGRGRGEMEEGQMEEGGLLTQTTETPHNARKTWVGAAYGWVRCCLLQDVPEVPPSLD